MAQNLEKAIILHTFRAQVNPNTLNRKLRNCESRCNIYHREVVFRGRSRLWRPSGVEGSSFGILGFGIWGLGAGPRGTRRHRFFAILDV